MVEKVFISPNRVRAYGNIINMKTGDDFTLVNSELTVTTDTVNGAEMTVFQIEVEGGISIALVSSASTCNVGDNVLLTATVLDDSAPVEAAEVTFKVGETVLGTDETDANGVATYTYAASTAGTFSFTAVYQDSASPVVSVSVNHSYSLSFSQSSYVASGGSATLECTLLEDNVAKTGASITVTGTDSSTYTATTNSSGVASVTVTGISASTVFTATYQGATATCTVTVQSYLFYDACSSSSGLSNYGSSVLVRGTNASATISYDSTENAYKIAGTGNYFAGIPITPLKDLDNFKVTAEMKCGVNNWLCQIGFYTRDYTDTTKQAYSTHLFGNARYRWFYVTPSADGSYQTINTSSAHTSYTKMEWIVEGTIIKMNIYDSNDDVAYTITKDTVTYAKHEFGFWIGTERGTGDACYVRNIIAEPIQIS